MFCVDVPWVREREKKGLLAHTQKIHHANNTIVSVKKPTKKIICNSFNARLRLIFQNSIIMVLYDFFYTLSFPTLLRLYYVANMVVTSSTESSAYNFLKL